MNEHTDVEDLAMFALLLLSEEEAAQVRGHQEICPECRAELQRVRQDLAMYALATEPAPIPEGARDRFLAQMGETRTESATLPGRAPAARASASPALISGGRKRSILASTLPWVGWAVAAGAALMAFGLRQERDSLRGALIAETAQSAKLETSARQTSQILGGLSDPSAVRVSLSVPKAPALPSARATYNQKYGTLLLQASNLAPLHQNKVYELWMIPANGTSPIPAGTFSPDDKGNANLLIARLPKAVIAKAFGITVEHAGGSATPTMPIILAGVPG